MDKFQIVEVTERSNHAGTKATADIAVIAEAMGYQPLYLRMNNTNRTKAAKVQRQWDYFWQWLKIERSIPENAVVLLQHPFHHPQLIRERCIAKLKKDKHVKFISVVHDVEELRKFRYNAYYKREFDFMLRIADAIIVHNPVMKQFFAGRGVPERKLVVLGIFDYLQQNAQPCAAFDRAITVAGNLDTVKCQYIGQLGELKQVKVNLYGPNYDKKLDACPNVIYHGSFPSDEIPQKLTAGFGLVWDGESIEGCRGDSGQYLRYNNPHKLSLYLSSGMPVVIWCGAAEAAFVREHGVGICVESLRELDERLRDFSAADFDEMAKNVASLQSGLISGQYAKNAIASAVMVIAKG